MDAAAAVGSDFSDPHARFTDQLAWRAERQNWHKRRLP